jgi:DNA-3-methyladenine glycosylase I
VELAQKQQKHMTRKRTAQNGATPKRAAQKKPWMTGARTDSSPADQQCVVGPDGLARCPWVFADMRTHPSAPASPSLSPSQQAESDYHDHEWGRPDHDERYLIEQLILGGFQSGLSWQSIINKRENFRRDFDQFDLDRIARYGQADVERLMDDPGIIRNRRKIEGAIANARMIRGVVRDFGSLHDYIWHWTFGHRVFEPISTTTDPLSDMIAADLKKRGSKFLGSVTVFSYLQACGPICSHVPGCIVFEEFPPQKGDIVGHGFPTASLHTDGDIHFF